MNRCVECVAAAERGEEEQCTNRYVAQSACSTMLSIAAAHSSFASTRRHTRSASDMSRAADRAVRLQHQHSQIISLSITANGFCSPEVLSINWIFSALQRELVLELLTLNKSGPFDSIFHSDGRGIFSLGSKYPKSRMDLKKFAVTPDSHIGFNKRQTC